MAGGVERMACTMLEAMRQRGHEMSLLTWDSSSADAFYDIHPSIKWYQLGIGDPKVKASFMTRLKRALKMRAYLKEAKPDVILAFQEGTFISTRLYSIGMSVPVIAAERNAPSRFEHLSASKYEAIIYQCFRFASAITIQVEAYKEKYPVYLHDKIISISNPVNKAQKYAMPAGEGKEVKILLSIGRLSYQKNYDVLIKAFSEIADRFPNWRLVIVGEGEDRKKLEKIISDNGLGERIFLPGKKNNVDEYYVSSHFFCLPSRWEGFPNALAEAMAHGLPAVGFEGCSGVADLIDDGNTGLLANGNGEIKALKLKLEEMMENEQKRSVMGEQACEAIAVYEPSLIFDQWEQLFNRFMR